jgi:hypothetical protein
MVVNGQTNRSLQGFTIVDYWSSLVEHSWSFKLKKSFPFSLILSFKRYFSHSVTN